MCPPGLESFELVQRTYHRGRIGNHLYSAGHAVTPSNRDAQFTVDVQVGDIRDGFKRHLEKFGRADPVPSCSLSPDREF